MKLSYLRPLALSLAALLVSAPAAFALDANDFASKLSAVYGQSLPPGGALKLGAATVSGDAVSYDGVTVTLPDQAPVKLDTKLQFAGVKEQPDGSYVADTLSFPDIDYKFEGGEVSARNLVLKRVYVASGKVPDVLAGSRLFSQGSIGPITVVAGGKQLATIDSVLVTNTFAPSQTEGPLTNIASNGLTNNIKIDLAQISAQDPDSAKPIAQLGLSTLTAKAIENMTWSLTDGHIAISEISVDVDNVGKLKFALDMTGYTPEFVHNLSSVSQALAQQGTSNESAQSQQQTAMLLASLQTLFLNSTSLRFDDASITNKLLDIGAKQENTTKSALIESTVASIPAQLNGDGSMPVTLVQEIQAAVRAYLVDPHSIEVRLAPKSPLGVLGLVAVAMQPATAADTLGLQLVVNDKQITSAEASKETGVAPGGTTATPSSSGSSAAPSDSDNAATSDDQSDQSATDDGSDSNDDSGDQLTNKNAH
ncbi:MAG TPA: hypothetical protein VL418_04410 [Devosiaceae bacterium]|nr:hypothetical protein [Devosiaceae bacterium]